jgi:K+/H+ antiporter YhaU regulatory subunit KhtT
LPQDELLVLGIERSRKWLPLPRPEETINKGDRLVVYGPLNTLRTVFRED